LFIPFKSTHYKSILTTVLRSSVNASRSQRGTISECILVPFLLIKMSTVCGRAHLLRAASELSVTRQLRKAKQKDWWQGVSVSLRCI